MTNHQSHEGDEKGQTDSSYKLSRLKIPSDLTGKAVLDIGCNEGFFCDQALRRGAAKVVGIDADKRFLEQAQRRYSDERATYLLRSWHELPEGEFDLMLWTSAMHYELDPQKILGSIAEKLTPGGTFVLECGVQIAPRKEMLYSLRHDGGLWYPTLPLLEDMLKRAGFAFRMVSHAELVGTDPIPRVVFHCTRRMPTVLLLTGASKSGKSDLAGQLYPAATKVVSLDHFVSRIWKSKWVHSSVEKFIKENIDPNSLGGIYHGIDTEGLTEEYVDLLCKGVAATDELVVIEGYMTDLQAERLLSKLKTRARTWRVDRA